MEFNKLFFTLRQWPCGLAKSISIDFREEALEVSCAGSTLDFSYSTSEFAALVKALKKCHVEEWTSMDAPVLEGTVWSLDLYDSGNKVRSCHGIDRFPPQFEDFQRIAAPLFRKLREF